MSLKMRILTRVLIETVGMSQRKQTMLRKCVIKQMINYLRARLQHLDRQNRSKLKKARSTFLSHRVPRMKADMKSSE